MTSSCTQLLPENRIDLELLPKALKMGYQVFDNSSGKYHTDKKEIREIFKNVVMIFSNNEVFCICDYSDYPNWKVADRKYKGHFIFDTLEEALIFGKMFQSMRKKNSTKTFKKTQSNWKAI